VEEMIEGSSEERESVEARAEESEAAESVEAAEGASVDEERLASIVESILFATGEPLPLKRLVEVLDGPTPAEVKAAVRRVGERLEESGSGLRVHEIAGGFQLRTARENAEYVRAVFRDKPRKLGRAALETLAVIAYRQPVTRAEVEAIRGVDVDAVLTTLLQRNLVQVAGRKEAVGRPLLYGTTQSFLELFGFRDLSELPTLKELPTGSEGNPNEQATAAQPGEAAESAPGAETEQPDATALFGGEGAPGGGEVTAPVGDGAAAPGAGEASSSQFADGGQDVAAADAAAAAGPAWGEAAEAAEPRGDHLEAQGGGADPGGAGPGERQGGDRAGNPGEPDERQD